MIRFVMVIHMGQLRVSIIKRRWVPGPITHADTVQRTETKFCMVKRDERKFFHDRPRFRAWPKLLRHKC